MVVLQINIQLRQAFLDIYHHPIPVPERDTPLQMEISLVNVNLLHQMAFPLGFQDSPGAAVSEASQSGITRCQMVCCTVLPLTCLGPKLLMNASVEGRPDVFKFLTITNRALVHHLVLVLFHSFAKQLCRYKRYTSWILR